MLSTTCILSLYYWDYFFLVKTKSSANPTSLDDVFSHALTYIDLAPNERGAMGPKGCILSVKCIFAGDACKERGRNEA
mgnify:CR=1 FL=1